MQVSSTGNFLSVYRHLHTGTFLILPCRKDCSRQGHLPTRPNPYRLLPEKNSRAVTKKLYGCCRQFMQSDPSKLLSWRTDGFTDITCSGCAVKPLQLGKAAKGWCCKTVHLSLLRGSCRSTRRLLCHQTLNWLHPTQGVPECTSVQAGALQK